MDPKILVVFHTVEGQTAHIADRIVSVLRAADDTVDLAPVEEAPTPDQYDAVVAGGSIHAVHHSRQLVHYLEEHASTLERDAHGAVPSESHVGQSRRRAHRCCAGFGARATRQDRLRAGYRRPVRRARSCTPSTAGSSAGSCVPS